MTVAQQGKEAPQQMGADKAQLTPAAVVSGLYRAAYIVGAQTIRLFKRSGRRVVRVLRPANRWIRKTKTSLVSRRWADLKAEGRRFAAGFPVAFKQVKTAWNRHPVKGVGRALLLPFLAMRRHRQVLGRVFNVAAPVAAVIVLTVTLRFWTGQHYVLQLEVDGRQIGYIQDESVLNNASAMANDRVSEGKFELGEAPRLSIAMTDEKQIMSEEELCNKLLQMSGDTVAQLYGLYIDDTFEGATLTREGAEKALDQVKMTYAAGDKDVAVFLQKVEIREAVYPVNALRTTEAMTRHLLADKTTQLTHTVKQDDTWDAIAARYGLPVEEVKQLNAVVSALKPDVTLQIHVTSPRLQVQIEREDSYTQDIDFAVVTQTSDELFVGQKEVTGGEKGQKTIKAKVVLVNGVEVSRTVLSETVTREPVEQVILEGTKTISGDPNQNKGVFTWPVPICHNISRGLSYYHNGIDICNGPVTVNNQPFLATAAGTVVEASYGWNGGYGNMVRIDHGNGYTSYYAHCNSLSVTVGQQVKAGDMLGLIGNTGSSDGPHLHFEIRYHGSPIDPMAFF